MAKQELGMLQALRLNGEVGLPGKDGLGHEGNLVLERTESGTLIVVFEYDGHRRTVSFEKAGEMNERWATLA